MTKPMVGLAATMWKKFSNLFRNKKALFLVALVALVLLVIGGINRYTKVISPANEAKKLDSEVRKLISLPEGDVPTIATVTDPEKLKDQKFFANAQTGDKVLIYQNAGKAILFRPSQAKIIEIGTVAKEGATPVVEESVVQKPNSFVILNATGTSGLAKKTGDELSKKFPGSEITKLGNAKGEYTISIIIDLAGDKGERAKEIAEGIGLTISEFPVAENKIEGADFLIIVAAEPNLQATPEGE